jgi:hypothetical protein
MDELGPYDINTLRRIARRVGVKVKVHAANNPEVTRAVREAIEGGTPCIVLWRWEPTFGHFILVMRRGEKVELFDPLGDNLSEYFNSCSMNEPAGGNRDWLQKALQDADKKGIEVTYNPIGPQPEGVNSCGLWCLARAMVPKPSPENFAKWSTQ